MRFHKYHGLGNDFLVFAGGMTGMASLSERDVRSLCARGTGVGADGVILPRPSDVASLRMELVNRDGSIPEMCGNGIRCLVKYAVEVLGLSANPLPVETIAGVLSCRWTADRRGSVTSVRVAMGAPTFRREAIPMTGRGPATRVRVEHAGEALEAVGVGTGNPHMVLFGDARRPTAERLGPALTNHPDWPNGTNVEFVEHVGPEHLRVTVWERGCGLTRACGTGATAATAAAILRGHVPADRPIRVSLPGGDLSITVEEDFGQAWMEGPAEEVYRGELAGGVVAALEHPGG
ncbi:MAG: diaminopimelate epimerase [Myxococcota bacterium]